MKMLRLIWYFVPWLVIATAGLAICILAAITDFAWLDRLDTWLEKECLTLEKRLRLC